MKKICVIIVLALFLASCQAKPSPSSPQVSIQQNQSSNKEDSNVTRSHDANLPSMIIWVEEGEKQIVDESSSRWIGIRFKEVDLSKPVGWTRDAWDESGHTTEPRSDLAQILGQSIVTRDDAAALANKILASEQKEGNIFGGEALVLAQVEYDPGKNIWIFICGVNKNHFLGSNFCFAVDGASGELIRMWVM